MPEDYAHFLTTSHYDQLQQMLTALRSRDLPESDPNDPQRMITVRLPKSLHEALCNEAGRLGISVNKLCISRLLQVLDQKMVPETVSKPRGSQTAGYCCLRHDGRRKQVAVSRFVSLVWLAKKTKSVPSRYWERLGVRFEL